MTEVIGRFTAHTFALLRIIAGAMFALHGSQKVLGWPHDPSMPIMKGGLPPIAIAAGWIELICGVLIMVGFLTGFAAFIASGEMAFAYFMGHAKGGFFPTINKGELAVLYCFLWLYVAAHGAGIWSIDGLMRRRRPVTAPAGYRVS